MKTYYGKETKKALKNFPFSTHSTKKEFILSIVQIKKAAAVANYKAGFLTLGVKKAINQTCDEILKGKFIDQFLLSSFQGGAGTAINMNVNEVIANRATEIIKQKVVIHPNDHVNCSQSTNDVNPSALRITTFTLLNDLETALSSLIGTFLKKSKEFSKIKKLARTHLQDAIPTTLGAEFLSYTDNLSQHKDQLKIIKNICLSLNLGGTAIGDLTNTNSKYLKEVYLELNKITKNKFHKSKNLMAKTSGQVDFLIISQSITALCVDLSKIANDFKFMSSGPRGGIGEIILPELQNGSSIMPGKVNPIIPETLNQLYYLVSGNNLMIEKSVESAQLELGVMLPLIIDKLLESVILTKEAIIQFDTLCVSGVNANKDKCLDYLEKSTAYATLLVPQLGYDLVSKLVKETISSGKTLREVVVSHNHLSNKEFDRIIKIL